MKKFLHSFHYAWQGLRAASEESNIRIQAGVAVVVIAAGWRFDITATEWCIILLTIALVIGLEMINSAIESLVDLVTREHHPLAGKVKDIAAGAVLFASVLAIIIGVLVFWKYVVK